MLNLLPLATCVPPKFISETQSTVARVRFQPVLLFYAPKVRLKWYGFKGFPLIALIALGAFFHSTPGSAQFRPPKIRQPKFRPQVSQTPCLTMLMKAASKVLGGEDSPRKAKWLIHCAFCPWEEHSVSTALLLNEVSEKSREI